MAVIPFVLSFSQVVGIGLTARFAYQVSQDETLELTHILQQSTGAFDIYGISDSRGTIYSNASAGNPMDGTFVADIASAFNGIFQLPSPLVLVGGSNIYIDVINTSGAGNTIDIVMLGRRLLGSDK